MAAGNKPVWVQVAEAGFGDRLEELGWKRVSPAHWRLDGDGVIWRTLLGPARKDVLKSMMREDAYPNRFGGGRIGRLMVNCFADETGFELVGLDELIRKVEPDEKFRWIFPMIRRNVKVHLPFSIWTLYHDESFREAAEREEANWSWWDREWLGFLLDRRTTTSFRMSSRRPAAVTAITADGGTQPNSASRRSPHG